MGEQKIIATATASITGSYIAFNHDYITTAIVGMFIGLISWFYALTHAEPKWTRKQGVSELFKYGLFATVTMPFVIILTREVFKKYGYNMPEAEIALGAFASFTITDLIPTIVDGFKNFIKRVLK